MQLHYGEGNNTCRRIMFFCRKKDYAANNKKCERKEFNCSDFLRLTIQRVSRLIANDGTTFAFAALILKRTAKFTGKMDRKSEKYTRKFRN